MQMIMFSMKGKWVRKELCQKEVRRKVWIQNNKKGKTQWIF
jgi:hypothetical protein